MPPIPPIPIHTNDPIKPTSTTTDSTTAAKPDGTTPRTQAQAQDQDQPAHTPPTRTTPAYAPATTTSSAYDTMNPPPPQPGARPLAPTAIPAPTYALDPSPPEPSPYTATRITTETRVSGPPPQFSIPPPSDAQLAGRSTTTSTEPSQPGPTTLIYGVGEGGGPGAQVPGAPQASPYQGESRGGAVLPGGGSYGGGGNATDTDGAGQGGVGGAAMNLLYKAGDALKKGEEAAWRAVRNK